MEFTKERELSKEIMLEKNPRYQKKGLVSAQIVGPGEIIQVYPKSYPDRDSFQGMVVKKNVIEYGRGSKRDFCPIFRQVNLTVKPSHGRKTFGIGLGTAVKLIESREIPLVKTIRFKSGIRITKTRLAALTGISRELV